MHSAVLDQSQIVIGRPVVPRGNGLIGQRSLPSVLVRAGYAVDWSLFLARGTASKAA
jgi:hypothetical protein